MQKLTIASLLLLICVLFSIILYIDNNTKTIVIYQMPPDKIIELSKYKAIILSNSNDADKILEMDEMGSINITGPRREYSVNKLKTIKNRYGLIQPATQPTEGK